MVAGPTSTLAESSAPSASAVAETRQDVDSNPAEPETATWSADVPHENANAASAARSRLFLKAPKSGARLDAALRLSRVVAELRVERAAEGASRETRLHVVARAVERERREDFRIGEPAARLLRDERREIDRGEFGAERVDAPALERVGVRRRGRGAARRRLRERLCKRRRMEAHGG